MFVLSNEQMKFNAYNSILWFFIWSGPQENYSTVKKEILTIVLCIQNFQEDIFNKKFLLPVDCKCAKEILQKHV